MKDADDQVSIGPSDAGSVESAIGMAQKPPTQGVGVEGFVAFEAKPSEPKEHTDWERLVQLPPFQMYAVEQAKKSPADVMAWVWEFMRVAVERLGEEGFYDHYCKWHEQKGYWPNETPMGEPKDA